MPYIVTTSSEHIAEDGISTEIHIHERHAFATLDECSFYATEIVLNVWDVHGLESNLTGYEDYLVTAKNLPENGCAIGAMPDGTTITVWPIDPTDAELIEHALLQGATREYVADIDADQLHHDYLESWCEATYGDTYGT